MPTLVMILFWISLAIIAYTYVGYAIIIGIWQYFKKEEKIVIETFPEVTLIIAAYNEEDCIATKIQNSLRCQYPAGKLQIWVVTDGSNDQTLQIAQEFKNVRVFHLPERKGKLHAVNRVMKKVQTSITVFSDANTLLPKTAIQDLVKHFSKATVGVVAGEKRVRMQDDAASNEGIYWKYESMLKKWDARVHTATGAAGELFAIRTSLYSSVPADTLIEDFVLSLKIAEQGFTIAYEPKAYAIEDASPSIAEEMKRKVRITAGGLQASWRMRNLLNPFKYGIMAWQLASHRVMRWTLAPLSLPLVLGTNLWLGITEGGIYTILLAIQLLIYSMALLGKSWQYKQAPFKGFFTPYYFVMMNVCVYLGMLQLIQQKQSVVWQKAQRKTIATAV